MVAEIGGGGGVAGVEELEVDITEEQMKERQCLLDTTVLFAFFRAGAADSVAIVIVICFWRVQLNI